MLRVVEELRPRFVVAENVRGAINLALDTVHEGLETADYEVRTILVPASAFGAPHKRERIFVVGVRRDVADAFKSGLEGNEWAGAFREEGETALGATAERGGSLWPTPDCNNHRDGSKLRADNNLEQGGKHGVSLHHAVCHESGKSWPTPRGGEHGVGLCGGVGHLEMLRKSLGIDEARKISAGNGGKLNAAWVEQLQGFPDGWTDIECTEPKPWAGWPALMGLPQYPYEHPRTIGRQSHRAARLKALGNAVVPQQARPFFEAIRIMEEMMD